MEIDDPADSKNLYFHMLGMAQVSRKIRLDCAEYPSDGLPEGARTAVECLDFIAMQIQEKSNQIALLSKAKNAYIHDLKAEIIKKRSGVDLITGFDDD